MIKINIDEVDDAYRQNQFEDLRGTLKILKDIIEKGGKAIVQHEPTNSDPVIVTVFNTVSDAENWFRNRFSLLFSDEQSS